MSRFEIDPEYRPKAHKEGTIVVGSVGLTVLVAATALFLHNIRVEERITKLCDANRKLVYSDIKSDGIKFQFNDMQPYSVDISLIDKIHGFKYYEFLEMYDGWSSPEKVRHSFSKVGDPKCGETYIFYTTNSGTAKYFRNSNDPVYRSYIGHPDDTEDRCLIRTVVGEFESKIEIVRTILNFEMVSVGDVWGLWTSRIISTDNGKVIGEYVKPIIFTRSFGDFLLRLTTGGPPEKTECPMAMSHIDFIKMYAP